MKKHISLTPPLDLLEKQLFGVTEGLMEAVQRGATSPGVSEAVRCSPLWTEYQEDLKEIRNEATLLAVEDIPAVVMPDHVRDLIRRRVAAKSLISAALPRPGQIVLIEKIVTPRPNQVDGIMQTPLYVLLDAPAEAPVVWHGWLVSAETDYAGWWDFVLQEQDAPFDPEAAMVQLWNPVRIYLPMAARVVGQLSLARLQAVRALAADFATSEPPAEIKSWPGRVASRTTSTGLLVTTGSPLSRGADERAQYQDLYFRAAEAVREPARLALRSLASVPVNRVGAFLNRLIAGAGKAAEILLPEPRIAIAMNSEEAAEAPDLSWPDAARLRILDLTPEGDGRMEIRAIGKESLIVEIRNGADVESLVNVAPGGSDIINWDQASTDLFLILANGRRLELSLKGIE